MARPNCHGKTPGSVMAIPETMRAIEEPVMPR